MFKIKVSIWNMSKMRNEANESSTMISQHTPVDCLQLIMGYFQFAVIFLPHPLLCKADKLLQIRLFQKAFFSC